MYSRIYLKSERVSITRLIEKPEKRVAFELEFSQGLSPSAPILTNWGMHGYAVRSSRQDGDFERGDFHFPDHQI